MDLRMYVYVYVCTQAGPEFAGTRRCLSQDDGCLGKEGQGVCSHPGHAQASRTCTCARGSLRGTSGPGRQQSRCRGRDRRNPWSNAGAPREREGATGSLHGAAESGPQ